EQWAVRGTVPGVGSSSSIATMNVVTFTQDPGDRLAFYVGTDARGGFLSWDGGTAWRELGKPFASARVDAIAVDPRAKCTIYAGSGPRVYRTTDCARTWQSSDFEASITTLALDPQAPATIYIGNAKGDILKSVDSGASWRAIARFENRVKRLLIAPSADGRGPVTIYAATQTAGIRRSVNNGDAWVDLRKGMEQYPGAFDYKSLTLVPDHAGQLLYASKYGILRSVDSGTTWTPIALITAPGAVDISAIAVNPRRGDEIAYTTGSTFYKTSDGGRTWVSKKLPTRRLVTALHVDAADANTIWMTTLEVKK
ncbi:hypothetical protein HY480_04805, partial [Candidatus Uhrbacteria bacterium]|nr:hypothetical protein [Candidatus Uhrbacteria bacterium]